MVSLTFLMEHPRLGVPKVKSSSFLVDVKGETSRLTGTHISFQYSRSTSGMEATRLLFK